MSSSAFPAAHQKTQTPSSILQSPMEPQDDSGGLTAPMSHSNPCCSVSQMSNVLGGVRDQQNLWEITIADVPSTLKIIELLIRGGGTDPLTIIDHGRPMDTAVLMCLALNEQARSRKAPHGFFYHLPLREVDRFGHPCDMVFLPNFWTPEQVMGWDKGCWESRMAFCSAVRKASDGGNSKIFSIDSSKSNTKVVPICVRIFQPWPDSPDSCVQGEGLARYATTSDPAMSPGQFQYSRTLDDQSTWAVMLNSEIGNRPISCRFEVLEGAALECVEELHHSMAFRSTRLYLDSKRTSDLCSIPGQRSHDSTTVGFEDILLSLLSAVDDDNKGRLCHPEEWGDLQRSWTEIKSIVMDNQRQHWGKTY